MRFVPVLALAAACGGSPTGAVAVDGALPKDGAAPDDASAAAPAVTLTEVAIAGASDQAHGLCLVFADLDGDDRPELFLLPASDGSSPVTAGQVFHNAGGAFDAPLPVAFHGITFPNTCAAGDFDNDGLLDLFIASMSGGVLLHNKGALQFEDVSDAAGVTMHPQDTEAIMSAGFLDYDVDGKLDLYVGRLPSFAANGSTDYSCGGGDSDFACVYLPGHEPQERASLLLRNLDGSRFAPVAGEAGAPNFGAPNAIASFDWSLDGWPELFVADDFGVNRFYLNDKGRFTNVAARLGVERPNNGMGCALADFDGDGRWDLFVADSGPNEVWFGRGAPGAGDFVDRSFEVGVGEPTRFHTTWGPVAADFDQDGAIDLFVPSSGAASSYAELGRMMHEGNRSTLAATAPQHDFLFVNRGGALGFSAVPLPHTRITPPAPFAAAAAAADLDGDGDLDVAEIYGRWPATFFRFLRNDTPQQGSWLAVRLVGHKSNRSGIGATVFVEAAGTRQMRTVNGESGSIGKGSDTVHFGLGKVTVVDKLEVLWPGGARQQVPGPIAAGKLVVVDER